MKLRSSVLAVLVVLLGAAPAAAAPDDVPRTFRLDVRGHACITGESLREALAAVLRSDPVDATAGARLEVDVIAGSTLARGRWRILDAAGAALRERTITVAGGGCVQLLHDLALSLAVAYESSAPAPPPAVGCDAACRAQIRAEVREELCREHPRSCNPVDITPVLLVGGMFSAGFTSDVGGGAWLGGELRFGEIFSGALEARVLFPSRVVSQPTGFAFDVTTVTAALVPCARWSVLLGCAFVDVGALFATVTNTVPFSGPPVVATLGFGPRVAVHIPFADRFAARIFAELRIAPAPSSFVALDTGSRWESNPVSGTVGAAIAFQ